MITRIIYNATQDDALFTPDLKEIHPQIKDDPRYTAMLGQDGSSPLDLFWDEIGEEETKFRALRRTVLSVLEVSLPGTPWLRHFC